MLTSTIDFANLLLGALVAGTMFGIWLGYNPAGLSAGVYVSQQQHAIGALNVVMPVLGGLSIVLTLVAAAFAASDRTRLILLLSAAGCFIAAGLITRLLNQPINAIVMTWSADAPPTDWMQLRDDWWRWHVMRTVAGIGGLSLLIIAALKRASVS
ncbi:MAG: DUF1772 domain-containing protein [Rubrivivax sp.]|nr:DUF1772 domain-containing protein [Rubrivivax sp.]